MKIKLAHLQLVVIFKIMNRHFKELISYYHCIEIKMILRLYKHLADLTVSKRPGTSD